MSHFTVVVTGKDVEQALAPFNEDTNAVPEKLLSFEDNTEEVLEEWNGLTAVEQHKFKDDVGNYAESHFGYRRRRGDDGDTFGYYRNPQGYWDWWVVGGRWTGFFKVKAGVPETRWGLGRPGVFGNAAPAGYADQITKGDVDWDGMRDDHERVRLAVFDKVNAVFKEHGTPPTFKAFLRDRGYDGTNQHVLDEARTAYSSISSIVELRRKDLLPLFHDVVEMYGVPREAFARDMRLEAVSPYALVHNGEWMAPGKMGWWGLSSDTRDEKRRWDEKVNALLAALPDDTLLTLVDCHV